MQTIIQLSDFHILQTDLEPDKNDIFVGMINAIKSIQLGDNPILVYNGDFIHFTDIQKKVDKSTAKKRSKEKQWYYYMKKSFLHAEKYFRFLINNIGIEKDRIVLCCGNHDVFAKGIKTIEINCPKGVDVKIEKERFKLFSDFCFRITGRENCEHTKLYQIDGFNFLVQNSNWTDKWVDGVKQNELCINCTEVIDLIVDNQNQLIEAGKARNIFVSHAPEGDFCENSHYRFLQTQNTAVMPEVNRYFGLKLFGDKHTDYNRPDESITGAPLSEEEISVKLFEFDSDNKHHQITVKYSDGEWKTVGAEEDIAAILAISEEYIKDRAKLYLFGSEQVDELPLHIKEFASVRLKPNWGFLNQLLCASADIKKTTSNNKYATIDLSTREGKFIETLTSIITDSSEPIKVEGEPRQGKSVCLSIVYMHMLNQYASGVFPFVPLYFDIEKAFLKTESLKTEEKAFQPWKRDSEDANREIMQRFDAFLLAGIEYSKKVNRRICCIIDGINQYRLYNKNRIEDSIFVSVEKYTRGMNGKEPPIARLIYCIDSNCNDTLGATPQIEVNAEYTVFFDPILSNFAGKSQKLEKFVHAYSLLQSGSDDEEKRLSTIYKNLELRL